MKHVQRLLPSLRLLLLFVMASAHAQSPPGVAPLPTALPAWPQQFVLTAPAQATFGFMVTQPGPVSVDVTVTGSPVVVTLSGPASQPVQQSGTGRMHLVYAISPQELARGLLWTLRIAPAVPGNGAQASGSVSVIEPAVDPKLVQQTLQAGASANTRVLRARAATPLNAQLGAAVRSSLLASVQQRQARFVQSLQQPIAQEYDRIRPYFQKAQASSQPLSPSIAAIPSNIPLAASRYSGARLPPPPVAATALSVAHGAPGTPLIISGGAFGTEIGEVHFVVGAGLELVAKIDLWSDNQIFTSVPDAIGVPGVQGGHLYVVRNSDKGHSNSLDFQFDPHLTLRFIVASTDQVLGWPFEPINMGGVAHSSYNPFNGFAGVDFLLSRSALRNGWKLADPSYSQIVCGSVQPGQNQVSNCDGFASLQLLLPGSAMPKFQVLWSLNSAPAFGQSRLAYMYSVGIVGPLGTPDGMVCMQLPCDGFPNSANSSEEDIMNQLSKAADSYAQLLSSTLLN